MFHKINILFLCIFLAISLVRSWRAHKLTLTSPVYDFSAPKKDKMFSAAAQEYNIATVYLLVLQGRLRS